MIKSLIKNIILVIISPKYGWEVIERSGVPAVQVLTKAFYPLLGVLALSSFAPMIYDPLVTFSTSLMRAIIAAASFFFCFFLCVYLAGVLYPELVKSRSMNERMNQYILYCFIYLVLIEIVKQLLPTSFSPLFFMVFYMAYIAYRGTEFVNIGDNDKNKFTLVMSAMILGFPLVIDYVLNLFIIR